jgi:hypothetical protein
MNLNPTDYQGIRAAVGDGRAFCIRYEYTGYNGENVSGQSDKFWCIERPSANDSIRVRYGKNDGRHGQTANRGISFWDADTRADKKLKDGYVLVSQSCEDAPAPEAAVPTATLPPLSEWAATMPAPFNAITSIDTDGRATNASGQLVCNMTVSDANTIRAQYLSA